MPERLPDTMRCWRAMAKLCMTTSGHRVSPVTITTIHSMDGIGRWVPSKKNLRGRLHRPKLHRVTPVIDLPATDLAVMPALPHAARQPWYALWYTTARILRVDSRGELETANICGAGKASCSSISARRL